MSVRARRSCNEKLAALWQDTYSFELDKALLVVLTLYVVSKFYLRISTVRGLSLQFLFRFSIVSEGYVYEVWSLYSDEAILSVKTYILKGFFLWNTSLSFHHVRLGGWLNVRNPALPPLFVPTKLEWQLSRFLPVVSSSLQLHNMRLTKLTSRDIAVCATTACSTVELWSLSEHCSDLCRFRQSSAQHRVSARSTPAYEKKRMRFATSVEQGCIA